MIGAGEREYNTTTTTIDDHFFELIGPAVGENKKFRITTIEYQIKWKNMQESENIELTMHEAITEVLRRIYASGKSGSRIAVSINHPALNDPIYIGYTREEKMTTEKIVRSMWKVQQSKKGLNFEENLDFKFSLIHAPVGGRVRQKYVS